MNSLFQVILTVLFYAFIVWLIVRKFVVERAQAKKKGKLKKYQKETRQMVAHGLKITGIAFLVALVFMGLFALLSNIIFRQFGEEAFWGLMLIISYTALPLTLLAIIITLWKKRK